MKRVTLSGLIVTLFMLCWSHPIHSQQKDSSMKPESITRRTGSLIKVRPEYEERYLIIHKHVFPEVLDRIHASNIRNYTIFLLNGILFSYYEYVGPDYDADMKAIGDTVTKEWWKLTDPMQEPLATRKPGEWWATMDPVFEAKIPTSPQVHVERIAYAAAIKQDSTERVSAYYREHGDALVPFLQRFHISNVHCYTYDGTMYVYGEYSGSDVAKDLRLLNQEQGWREWNIALNRYLDSPVQRMMIAFHTD